MNNDFARTLDNLTKRLKGRIFLICENRDYYSKLISNARSEGYYVPKSFDEDWDIVSLNIEEHRLGWGGTYFHMAFYFPDVYRIDYGKYLRGDDDYIYHGGRRNISENYQNIIFDSKNCGRVTISGNNNKDAEKYYHENNMFLYEKEDEEFLLTQLERMFKVLVITER